MTLQPLYIGQAESDEIVNMMRDAESVGNTFDDWARANELYDGFALVARDQFVHIASHIADIVALNDEVDRAQAALNALACLTSTIEEMFEYGHRVSEYQATA